MHVASGYAGQLLTSHGATKQLTGSLPSGHSAMMSVGDIHIVALEAFLLWLFANLDLLNIILCMYQKH